MILKAKLLLLLLGGKKAEKFAIKSRDYDNTEIDNEQKKVLITMWDYVAFIITYTNEKESFSLLFTKPRSRMCYIVFFFFFFIFC